MSKQAATGTSGRTAGRDDPNAIVGDDHFQVRLCTATRCLEGETQMAVYVCPASVTGGIAQSFLHGSKDKFGNCRRCHLVNTACCLFGDAPFNLVKRMLEI